MNGNTVIDGILTSPQNDLAASEKSGLLASMLQEKKDLVNGVEPHEQYKKMNGNKRPASTEPPTGPEGASKKPLIESNGSSSITIPEGSSISTTAGGQKVITTPEGKQIIIKVAPNGTQMVVGTIDPVVKPPSGTPRPPIVNGQVNGNGPASPAPSSSSSSTSPTSSGSAPTASGPTTLTVTSVPKPNPNLPFLCEWQGCMKAFKTPKEVEKHAIGAHCPLGSDDIPCLWQRCDAMKRKRFSLMTHLQDRHCHPQVRPYDYLIRTT